MSKLAPDTVERIYAGWYGKLIGIRHGSNIENWPAEKIAERYGEITGYLFDFKHFAADDDSNGPLCAPWTTTASTPPRSSWGRPCSTTPPSSGGSSGGGATAAPPSTPPT